MADSDLPPGTRTYTGLGAAGNTADPRNWDGTHGINERSIALIPIDATLNGTTTVRQMMMLGDEAVTVNGVLATQSLGFCVSFMICNDAVVTFTPTSTLNDAGGIIVGADETGTLVAQGGHGLHSTLNTVAAKIGQHAGSHGTATIDGAVWNDTTNMYVGEFGQGALSVVDGGQVNIGKSLVVGSASTASGQVALMNGGVLNVSGTVRIGAELPAGTAGNGAITIGAGSTLNVVGGLMVSSGGAMTLAGGTVAVSASDLWIRPGGTISGYGTVTVSGSVHDGGTIQAAGGTLVLNGALGGHGVLQIAAGATAQVNAATIGIAGISFTGADASLTLTHGVADHAVISGFGAGDSITMAGIDQLDWNAGTDVLTLSSGGQVVDALHFAGTYAAGAFDLSQSALGAMITLHVATTH